MDNEPPSSEDILYILNHVFLPPQIPQFNDNCDVGVDRDITLCRLVYNASLKFSRFLSQSRQRKWSIISEMLKMLKMSRTLRNTRASHGDLLVDNICRLVEGGVFAFHINAQNAGIILRRRPDSMVFEVFEVSPTPEDIMNVEGKLICSYPGPAVELPLDVAQNHSFVKQLVSFLIQMDVDEFKTAETRGTTHPRFITQLLIMILRGMGTEAKVDRIAKRIADDVCWDESKSTPWQRSSVWLVIRVAVQTTADSRDTYKAFMIFFQTELLQLFLDQGLSSDLIHAVRVKTSRRVHKLGISAPPQLLQVVQNVVREIQQSLQTRWSEEQHLQVVSPSYTPDSSAFEEETRISLLESRTYLTRIMYPNPCKHTVKSFRPSHFPRLRRTDDFHNLYSNGLTKAIHADPFIALADFEFIVQEYLDGWVIGNSHNASACDVLASLLAQYISATKKLYVSSPEAQSLMLLTIMELWVALDTIAVVQCPLLLSYSPEIPFSFLDPLLLRRGRFIERAAQIELYLRQRHSKATLGTSIFSDELQHSTFAVRYFQSSPTLISLKASIERSATDAREKKFAELRNMNAKHKVLLEQSAKLSCHKVGSFKHSIFCRKCSLEKEAGSLLISIHEWPLPTAPLEAEAILFELNCPPVFAIWRTQTYQILRDIGTAHVDVQSKSVPPPVCLETYDGLSKWLKKGLSSSGRFTFKSPANIFLKSKNLIEIPSDETSICIDNSLRFRLYDNVKGEGIHSSFSLNLDSYCTLPLPKDGVYGHLQYAVSHVTHTHNEIIVTQGDCPINMSLHEQLAFTNLRCGPRLQWKNIARELRTNVLTFSREEVHTLITQAAWQIGPLSNDGSTREYHFELGVSEFGFLLIQEASDLLSHVESNWMEVTTVKSIIYLIICLLASTGGGQGQLQECGYALLRRARQVTHKWMHEILRKLQDAVDEDVGELQRRACEMGATCRATFDVDAGAHLEALLSSESPADVAILVECAIVIHHNTPPNLRHTFPDFQKLLHRDRRLSHHLEFRLSQLIHDDRHGLDSAVRSVWSEYRPGDVGWRQLQEPNSRWVTTLTAHSPGQRTQQVHYDMLDGRLLVDGKLLGRLPREVVEHSTYRRIFGQKILDVIPADMPGMDYATQSLVSGYQVFFALRGIPQNLIIRARRPSGKVFELVPHNVLLADFPTIFSTEYAHWMDVDTGEVEFRPLNQLWDQSSENWRLVFLPDGLSKMVHGTSGTRYLIDIRSRTFQGTAMRIHPLELPEYLTTVYDVQWHTISIDLPRFRLSFFLNTSGQLESKNMQGMIIDNNQCTGTMIGLSSQLVLRHKDPHIGSLPRSRFVLMPHGQVRFTISPDRNHVRVSIDTSTNFTSRVRWYKYEIDSDLGLLVGNASLTSRLYKIYLHALCSHPLPDPLTSQTGTDHALQELGSASCFSFQTLTEIDIELLRLIKNITPLRYRHSEHWQVTKWSLDLPALSQHYAFDTAVQSILQYAQSLAIFTDAKVEKIDEHKEDSFLMKRAMRRNTVYYAGVDANTSRDLDDIYNSRDALHVIDREADGIEACNVSRLVHTWPIGLTCRLEPSDLLQAFQEWGSFKGPTPGTTLVYTREWLGLDLSTKWFSIYDLCRQIDQDISKKFELVFSFAALAYNAPGFRKFIPILLAVATIPRSLLIAPPPHLSYDLKDGFEPHRELVQSMVASGTRDFRNSPAMRGWRALFRRKALQIKPSLPNKITNFFPSQPSIYYEIQSRRRNDSVMGNLMNQWRRSTPQSPFRRPDDSLWFDIKKIMDSVAPYLASCSRNTDILLFASQLTIILQSNYISISSPFTAAQFPRFYSVRQLNIDIDPDCLFNLRELLSSRACPAPVLSTRKFGTGAPINPRRLSQPINTKDLQDLISQFQHNNHTVLAQIYSERLERSRRELDGTQNPMLPENLPPLNVCLAYRDQCQARLHDDLESICSALAPSTPVERILADAGLWPRIHPRTLLHALASTANISLSRGWFKNLTTFAETFIEYQHSQRLVAYALRLEIDNFFKELDNASFNQSDAKKYPDWLLIQIQGNFLIRAVQSAVAHEMITPSSSQSTVLQLNMGEGKSSVIVPLVAAALADSRKLVRVVILKPLADQMFHLLVERISGLANRRIFYLPFSREVKMEMEQIQCIRNLLEECALVQGVLVAQPEHILSFRLMVIDRTLSSGLPLSRIAQELQQIQAWLTSTSRDILDESDELLHVRYQLIYAMDDPQPLDGGPDRWTTTQKVFGLIHRYVEQLREEFPEEVEILTYEGKPSRIRLLGISASDALLSKIAEDALGGALDNLTFVGLNTQPLLRAAVLRFIKEHSVDSQTYLTVKQFYRNSGLWKGLLLLRGLIAHGILVYVLSQRRWRVDYGLNLKRSLLAVPYRAKDMPSPRSEFGHPDVAVCLTCLSYYYGGLTSSQVRECFDLLLQLDNPPLEYERWVKQGARDIPILLRQLIGVNTKDMQTFMNDVVPIFQYNQAVIDFFLSKTVFPNQSKQFHYKLGVSGWDLVEKKANFITGFSGTNDNSDLFPTSITQSDPANQLRTDAQVLGYLLQPENTYICTEGTNGQPCSVAQFLQLLVQEQKEVRILLDVGAQMLDMNNHQLIKHWLSLRPDVEAGVFFDDVDRLSVLSQDGMVEPLYSSSFFQRLHQCIIYLDEAHTRGTDLTLPRYFRAMVTLGPNVTKDRLVQGCMRMRKLGHGQFVIFCAPPEVDRRIRQYIHSSRPVKVIDVLSWVMSNTCTNIEHHIPHWYQQGLDYHKRRAGDPNAWLQPAARSLEEMYGLTTKRSAPCSVDNIPAMRERLRMLQVTTVRDAGMEEEQEREVSHEVNQELQPERPPRVPPAIHHLDHEVRCFIREGTISTNSDIFFPLMTPLRFKSHMLSPENPWSNQLLATRDFMTTTEDRREKSALTEYLRPVNWIVSRVLSDGHMILVVMSPYEVNILLQDIRASKYICLHMYAARTSQAMKPIDDLTFYCTPPLPPINPTFISPSLDVQCQLNIWSGQLYLDQYETYLRLCLLLGVSSSETAGHDSMENDRFVSKKARIGEMVDVCLFYESPLALLKILFDLRRKGMSYKSTHMGKILHARLLSREDFEE